MAAIEMEPIGVIRAGEEGCWIEVEDPFRPGLEGLTGFGWVQLLWWAHQADDLGCGELVCSRPYLGGPERVGIFATRSPRRPNAIGLSAAQVTGIDLPNGLVHLAWVDCHDETPLLDLKPYHPSADRVEAARVPDWCRRWPTSVEASAAFDWSQVFPA